MKPDFSDLTKTLYIIDDDKSTALLNSVIMQKKFGFKTEIFTDPDKAFLSILQNRLTICGLIVDAYMQIEGSRIGTGIQLVKEIHIDGIEDLPVLFCTSLTGATEIASMLKHGDYCVKPLHSHIDNEKSPVYSFLAKIK
jgi:response regulator of citrate/malate metabolism